MTTRTKSSVEITEPGNYAEPGTTYVLTKDITCPTRALFLGKDVTLDLNGHTITYAAGPYEHVPNTGFEQGLENWDLTNAPGAKIESAKTLKPFVGDCILRLPAGREIVSQYISLPVADRSYYAMCGVLNVHMKITLSVEDQAGKPVVCRFDYGQGMETTCPEKNRNPKLGGGFVIAHLHHLPVGKYRIRVKAENDCLIDEVDIRPAMDVGIGIVERIIPNCYHRRMFDENVKTRFEYGFFDYADFQGNITNPAKRIPHVTGAGKITIKNGVIKNGFEGVASWGIQSTAKDVMIELDRVKITAAGINTNAFYASKAKITNCRFEVDTPFIIDRHWVVHSAVSLVASQGSEVAHNEFIGGQGCLCVRGGDVKIHDNLFVNRQTVTNHYSLSIGKGENCDVYNNRFHPEMGSGIGMRARNSRIHHNEFKIKAENGNCEYNTADGKIPAWYTTAAIRISDYNRPTGSPTGAFGNEIYSNKFEITGRHYANFPGYRANVTAIYCTVGAGQNRIHDNEIVVNHQDPESTSPASAFYVCSSRNGGEYYNNTITTNCLVMWAGSFYGNASNIHFHDNTIVKSENAPKTFKAFKLGDTTGTVATGVHFGRNKYVNTEFDLELIGEGNTYTCEE